MNFDRRCQRIYQIGCLACRKKGWFSQCQVHHLNLGQHAGQKRLGDKSTIGLCPWHHDGIPLGTLTRAECRKKVGPSMKHEPVKFRKVFGSDASLLEWQDELIEEAELRVIGRRKPLERAGSG